MQESVRDTGVEERVYEILSRDETKIWNVATLAKEVPCSRAKIDRAFIALEVENRITVERLVGNSWIPRIKKRDSSAPGNGSKSTRTRSP
jgi:hypothetical protein